jgi:AcrR family transcriptional regulator
VSASKIPAKDRRILKTRDLLHRALAALIHEKPYDSISVKEILDRANVGRSTFYTHFRDKDELLVSAIHDLLHSVQSGKTPSSAKRSERMISFSLPIFEHIDHHRRMGEASMGAGGRAVLHGHLRGVLAELIADDLAKGLPAPRKAADQIPSGVLVEYLSLTFVLVLNWWIESRSRLSPRDVNDVFRALALPTLATVGL